MCTREKTENENQNVILYSLQFAIPYGRNMQFYISVWKSMNFPNFILHIGHPLNMSPAANWNTIHLKMIYATKLKKSF